MNDYYNSKIKMFYFLQHIVGFSILKKTKQKNKTKQNKTNSKVILLVGDCP